MTANSLFLSNKYTRWYYTIITKAQGRITNEYTEIHHIRSLKCRG